MSAAERMPVGIVVERHRIDHPWQPYRWKLVAVLPGRPIAAPWTVLAQGETWIRYFCGIVEIELFRSDTASYKHNLESATPAIFVVLRRTADERGIAVLEAMVDPSEAEACADAGDDLIELLPMPAPVADWVQAFVDRHHVERAFYKRTRDRADPEALGRRARVRPATPEDDD
jgi:Protein of unknown function (DUF3305)